MNNERYNQIIDEAYENYKNYMQENFMETRWNKVLEIYPNGSSGRRFYRDEFITECKTDPKFSEKWGLKIGERELTLEERYNKWFNNNYETGMERFFDPNELPDFDNSYYEPTPTKVVTVTYKDEKIKVYE
jgi:hypothetical protein